MARMAKWRRHTLGFKRQVVERMKTCSNIGALARELKLQRKLLYIWKYQFEAEVGSQDQGRTPGEHLGCYRQLVESHPDEAEMALRASVQAIVLAHHRRYGYRRVTAELHRRGELRGAPDVSAGGGACVAGGVEASQTLSA